MYKDDHSILNTPTRHAPISRGYESVPARTSNISNPLTSPFSSLFGSPWESSASDIGYFDHIEQVSGDAAAVARTLDYLELDSDGPVIIPVHQQQHQLMLSHHQHHSFANTLNAIIAPPVKSPPVFYSEPVKDLLSPTAPPAVVIHTPAILEEEEPTEDKEPTADSEVASRSLWIGNVDPALSSSELNRHFSIFGNIDSLRILSEKDCAFINYTSVEDAVNAKVAMQGVAIGSCIIRIGFGKTENLHESRGCNATKSLCMFLGFNALPGVGNIAPNTTPAQLESLFSLHGKIESSRVLTHKNCGFVNFVHVVDAESAYAAMNGKEIMGAVMKINYAKVPKEGSSTLHKGRLPNSTNFSVVDFTPPRTDSTANSQISTPSSPITPASLASSNNTSKPIRFASGNKDITPDNKFDEISVESGLYASCIPALPEPNLNRKIDQTRLRQMRKKLDGHCTVKEVENLLIECLPEAVELCTDYIGNVIIQKLVEKCTDQNRLRLLERIGAHIAAIGIHKNGTWAIQKMIDYCKTSGQITLLVHSISKLTPALLLDQFGNYVIQCCLRVGVRNQFIFDAMNAKCWTIAQGRFGARAMKAILDSPQTTKRQQKHVATALAQHAAQLCTHSNGSLLITWLLDTSDLPGRYRVIAPKIAPHIIAFSKHKIAASTILKLVTQRVELDARAHIINEIFYTPNLRLILADVTHGMALIQKILSTACVHGDEKVGLAVRVRSILGEMVDIKGSQTGFKRLMDELSESIPSLRLKVGGLKEIVSPLATGEIPTPNGLSKRKSAWNM